MERRKLISLRGSYLLYLPKKVASRYDTKEVFVFWEGDFVGVVPPALRHYTADTPAPYYVVAGYAAGLDELEIPKSRDVEKAAEKVYAQVVDGGGLVKIRYVDRYVDKGEVVDRMVKVLLYLLEGLAGGTATRRVVEAADDESDVLRLTVNRLCAKWPTPRCAFYIQLARYYERAVDHIRELYLSESQPEMWAALLEAARELAGIHERRTVDHIVKFLTTVASRRFYVMQKAKSEIAMLHAVRVIDYMENSAEVYLDMAIYDLAGKKPTLGEAEARIKQQR
jgi:hypothetical protein